MKPVTVTEKKFRELIGNRSLRLMSIAHYLLEDKTAREDLIRPVLGEMLSQSTQLEELLDSYGARNNSKWCRFRAATAAIKLFSDVSYELRHIEHSLPVYRLLEIEKDFAKATRNAMDFTCGILLGACSKILQEAELLQLPVPDGPDADELYTEQLPPGRLPHDRAIRKIENVSETVTMLATAFLNLAADSELLKDEGVDHKVLDEQEIPDLYSEEKLRALEIRFHNLQSLYDTYVSETETEILDENLPILRGHISVVFHLLRTATMFVHYYERHASCRQDNMAPRKELLLVDPQELLSALTDYSVSYASEYLGCARRLCQQMLKLYTEVEQIEVPVPQYRGFHVRPSTLISKLALHYGSDVKMEIDGEEYDACSPLELFRANEKINARKRRWLANEIVNLKLVYDGTDIADIKETVRSVVLAMAETGKVILYEQPLQFSDQIEQREGSLLEQVTAELARMLAMGKIDIHTDIRAKFTGDKRVLNDIKLLIETGYGEDRFGNNVPLPKRLAYLRQ